MKKPLFALPVMLSFLAASTVCLVQIGMARGAARRPNGSGLAFLGTRDSGGALSPDSAQAAGSDTADKTPVKRVELFVLDPGGSDDPAGSASISMGFLIELEPDWHIYWTNPGDAGLAPSVRWTLPPGTKAGPLLHPTPRKSVEEGIVSFGHEGPVLLMCDITPAKSPRPRDEWEAAAVLEWMACRESCITGETAVKAVFPPDAAAREKGRSLLETFGPKFPRPLSEAALSAKVAGAERSGAEWLVEVALSGPRAREAGDFFPYPLEDFVISHPRITCRDGRMVIPLTPSRGAGSPPPTFIRGLVIIGGAGYELTAPVPSHQSVSFLEFNPGPSWR